MITDREVLSYVVALYAYPGVSSVSWDYFDNGLADDGVCWAAKRVDDVLLVINRGSVTLHDFEEDAAALLINDHDLGPVHAGFMLGMRKQWAELAPMLDGAWIAAGHSLGAARACLLAGLGVAAGVPPVRYVRFGEPRPGCRQLAGLIADLPGASYRTADADGYDRVTDVPFHVAHLFEYVHPQPLVRVVASPPADDPWGPWRYHHIQLYQAGLA